MRNESQKIARPTEISFRDRTYKITIIDKGQRTDNAGERDLIKKKDKIWRQ